MNSQHFFFTLFKQTENQHFLKSMLCCVESMKNWKAERNKKQSLNFVFYNCAEQREMSWAHGPSRSFRTDLNDGVESHIVKSALQESSAAKVSAGALHLHLGTAFKQWLSPQVLLELHSSCDAAVPLLAMYVFHSGCTGHLQLCHGGHTLWACSGLWAGPRSPSLCWLYWALVAGKWGQCICPYSCPHVPLPLQSRLSLWLSVYRSMLKS